MDFSNSLQQSEKGLKSINEANNMREIDHKNLRYPHCIVWTPIPCLTWIFPFIGHMGIAYTDGVIRDFAGPYYVSRDDMAFGNPTRYLQLPLYKMGGSADIFDQAVDDASEVYKGRIHNLFCDNCHSHVAMAMNKMEYGGSRSWNMIKLCFMILFKAKYVSLLGALKQWLPFLILVIAIILLATLI